LSAITFAAAAFCAATHAALQTGSGAGSGAGGATGAAGAAEVVTEVDAVEATDDAAALEAVTVNVYGVEAVKPVTEMGELLPVAVTPPGEEVTV
jgi:hypothetical protein